MVYGAGAEHEQLFVMFRNNKPHLIDDEEVFRSIPYEGSGWRWHVDHTSTMGTGFAEVISAQWENRKVEEVAEAVARGDEEVLRGVRNYIARNRLGDPTQVFSVPYGAFYDTQGRVGSMGSYHISLTPPDSSTQFRHEWVRQLQWYEPLLSAVMSGPHPGSYGDAGQHTEGSVRHAAGQWGMPGGCHPMEISGDRVADLRVRGPTGVEFRMYDQFPTRFLPDIMRTLVYIAAQAKRSENRETTPVQSAPHWRTAQRQVQSEGWNAQLPEEYVQGLRANTGLEVRTENRRADRLLETVVEELWRKNKDSPTARALVRDRAQPPEVQSLNREAFEYFIREKVRDPDVRERLFEAVKAARETSRSSHASLPAGSEGFSYIVNTLMGTGYSREDVIDTLDFLERHGLVKVERNPKGEAVGLDLRRTPANKALEKRLEQIGADTSWYGPEIQARLLPLRAQVEGARAAAEPAEGAEAAPTPAPAVQAPTPSVEARQAAALRAGATVFWDAAAQRWVSEREWNALQQEPTDRIIRAAEAITQPIRPVEAVQAPLGVIRGRGARVYTAEGWQGVSTAARRAHETRRAMSLFAQDRPNLTPAQIRDMWNRMGLAQQESYRTTVRRIWKLGQHGQGTASVDAQRRAMFARLDEENKRRRHPS